jgi:hypothetical protein
MMNERDFEKHVHGAIQWAAAEHNFFNELKNDLLLLKHDISLGKEKSEVRDIKHALKNFRYIGKAERRFDNHEKHVEEFLQKVREHELTVTGSVHDIQKLLERLHTEAASLIKDSSLYEGKIRELLFHLRDKIKDHEIDQAQAVLMQVEELIEDAEEWIATLPIDLKRAKKIVKDTNFDKSEEGYRDPNLEDFNNPDTLNEIKRLMEAYGCTDVRIQAPDSGGRYMVSGQYSPDKSSKISVHQVAGSKDIFIHCYGFDRLDSILDKHYLVHFGENSMHVFSINFKKSFTGLLEVLKENVEGKSKVVLSERLNELRFPLGHHRQKR